jgi:hypothetical protein
VQQLDQLGLDRGRQRRLGSRADRLEERLPVGEVPVDRVGDDADPSGGLSQDDRVGSAGACQLGAGLQQRTVEVAVG